jgi:hypothetical protein
MRVKSLEFKLKTMKRKAFITTLVLVFALSISCSKGNNLLEDGLSYNDFEKYLKSNMTYDLIVAKFGEPTTDIGSGIHIYVYELIDSTEMWIGYTDSILYARHMDSNHQLLHSLI